MSDKHLTELEWKKFSKGKGYKDAALLKALAALESGKTPEARLAALDEVEKQADVLRKANKGDKELGSYLDDAEKAAGKDRKLQELDAKKAADASPDEEEDSPALLTTKMIPLLRQVKKGDAMKAMVAIAGKDVAVMVSKRAVPPARRKLMTDYLGVSGGAKFAAGDVIWEENAVTFVLQTQAGGLAKKIKAALLKQVELRLKVRVRGEDPDDIDDDGEPAEDEGAETEAGESTPPTPEPEPAPAPAPASDEVTAFNARLAALMPQVKDTLTAAGPNAAEVKLKVGEAGLQARKKEFAPAHALLDEAEKLMAAGSVPPNKPDANVVRDPQSVAFNARLAALMPKVKEAITAAGPNAAGVKLKVGEAGGAALKKDFAAANALLNEVEQLMAAPVAGGAVPSTAEFDALRAQVEVRVLEATAPGVPPALADQVKAIRTAWDMASELAEKGDHARALVILKRLADGEALARLLEARGGSGDDQEPGQAPQTQAGPGIVQQRKFMLERWARLPSELNVELQTLTQVLTAEGGDPKPKELAEAIDTHLQDLLADIKGQLDDAINAGDMGSIKGLRSRVETDGVMAHLLKAPFMDGSRFKSAVLDAMDEIEAGLTA